MSVGSKILLVEDDQPLRQSIAKLLESHGYSVSQAGNGDVGQFMTLLSDYDLVISDILMPEIDGIAMTKFIRQRTSTPIILITGLKGKEMEERAKEAQADLFLTKPFDGDDLLEAVEKVLQKKRISH
ncbi:MAG TPA: response regulator [Bdellovibrionota bacterium]|jgi:DNA-binding response OmpR family regulator